MLEEGPAEHGQYRRDKEGQETESHRENDAVDRRRRGEEQCIAAALIGIIMEALQPDHVADHEQADGRSGEQQSAEKEDQERADHQQSVHVMIALALIPRMSHGGLYHSLSWA